jgi:hypothetical protein
LIVESRHIRNDDFVSGLEIERLRGDRERDGAGGSQRAIMRTNQLGEPTGEHPDRLARAEKSGIHVHTDRLRALSLGIHPGIGEWYEGHLASRALSGLSGGRPVKEENFHST